MHPALVVVIGLVALVLVFCAVWGRQLRTRNAGMVDPVWSYSVGALGVLYAACANGDPLARWAVALGGGLWGLRLGTHLWRRNAGHPEDARYRRLRDEWGAAANRNMFWFFQLQAVFAIILSLGVLVVAYRAQPPATFWLLAALAVWILSVAGEGVADAQLKRFKDDPANQGKVCRAGLWRYSRHPNYFFECLHWFTYTLLAAGSGWIWVTLIPPVVMAFLLLKLSGIPITEAQTARSRPGYAAYMRTTSPFIPWPPKAANELEGEGEAKDEFDNH